MKDGTPERLTRWMLYLEQPQRLDIDHKVQDDLAWAADEIADSKMSIRGLEKQVSQRGARMQILYKILITNFEDRHYYSTDDKNRHPNISRAEIDDWFDDDGVPL